MLGVFYIEDEAFVNDMPRELLAGVPPMYIGVRQKERRWLVIFAASGTPKNTIRQFTLALFLLL